ncbi:MAG: thioredoxin family protein [Burkholderiaceae bacterium]
MKPSSSYAADEPDREAVDAMPGALLLEFGTPWCGFCLAAQPLLEAAFQSIAAASQAAARDAGLRHLKIEDGRGRPLGRSFGVKLWPTLIFLRDGQELARLVRPQDAQSIAAALRQLSA